jgi:hypothetical protein
MFVGPIERIVRSMSQIGPALLRFNLIFSPGVALISTNLSQNREECRRWRRIDIALSGNNKRDAAIPDKHQVRTADNSLIVTEIGRLQ